MEDKDIEYRKLKTLLDLKRAEGILEGLGGYHTKDVSEINNKLDEIIGMQRLSLIVGLLVMGVLLLTLSYIAIGG